MSQEKFGSLIRKRREEKQIGLRKMAGEIGVSPTYLSKIERDEFSPPAEERVKKIAQLLDLDTDQLLARAGRVSSELTGIIRRQPHAVGMLLRAISKACQPDPRVRGRTNRGAVVNVLDTSGQLVASIPFAARSERISLEALRRAVKLRKLKQR